MYFITRFRRLILILLVVLFMELNFLGSFKSVFAGFPAQIPTGSIPTVTGTPAGALAIVLDNEQGYINVRGGPSTVAYDIIGVLVEGSQVPALGRTPGGDWVQIAYPGVPGGIAWVYSDLMVINGSLPVVEPPPTATPQVTATIDPTLAAQFLVEIPPTRLPTFTAPPPLIQPTFPVDAPIASQGRFPMGLLVIGTVIIGLLGTLVSFVSRR
jgi:hypothetical protein